ncbi:MAG: DUF1295 domain-containing protein [Planctomycetota bacterium]
MFDLSAYLVAFGAAALLMTVVWALHLRDEDASIVDPVWGPAIVFTGLVYALYLGRFPMGDRLVALLVPLAWAARLARHLQARHAREGEDRRYRKMREGRGDDWWWQSLYAVFWLQAVLAAAVALPLMAVLSAREPLGLVGWVGVVVAFVGFFFESVSDGQLARFKKLEAARLEAEGPGAERGVMNTGLWRYSRHPNYFGEAVLWWGVGISAWAVGATWGLIGSGAITFLLLRVSGVTLTESDIEARRPAYRDYIRGTNAFVPGRPRAVSAASGADGPGAAD